MALEIERKFKLKQPAVLAGVKGKRLMQAYVAKGAVMVRVRIHEDEDQAWLTLKTAPVSVGACHEWEYAIPKADALEMARQPGAYALEKTRYLVEHGGFTYEVDQYHGGLTGLYTVEVELPSTTVALELPDWVGEELTGQKAWSNEALALNGWPQ